MTRENIHPDPDSTAKDPDTTKGFGSMAEIMEHCGCCGDMMEKMKGNMASMCCGSSDSGEGNGETDAKTKTEDQTV